MFPINASSPQRVAIGAVVQISDGAVQTTGVSVKVLPQGTTASAGGGTIAYEEGVVHYLPTQAETNYASFILIAYKTGCIPATVTVVTSASGTAGYAGVDWGVVANKTTTNALTGTTIATTQKVDVETIKTQAVTAAAGVTFPTSIASPTNITAATGVVLSGVTHTGAVIPTVTTLTGHTAQTGDSFARLGAPAGASVSADVAAVKVDTAAILVDTGTTLDARIPAALVSGRMDVSVGAIAANAITAAATAADFGAEIADAVWDEAIAGHLTVGSTGAALNAAGSAGDPWATAIPGAYGAGTAGKILGDNVNATISSRASAADLATVAGYLDTEIAAILSDTNAILIDTTEIGVAGAGLTNINLPNQTMDIVGNITGNLSGAVGSVTGAVGSVTGAVGSVTGAVGSVAAGGIAAASFVAGAIDAAALAADAGTEIATAVLTTALTESYRAANAAPTLAQAQFELIAHMGQSSITSTTKTLQKLDGTTTAKTFTLDSATTPTAIDQAT